MLVTLSTHCSHLAHTLPTPQGLPLGSGLGSSAASAAAAAWAVNGLFGSPLTKEQLITAGLAAEAAVSGYHADNVGPSLLGGFVLIRWALVGGHGELISQVGRGWCPWCREGISGPGRRSWVVYGHLLLVLSPI